MALICKSCGASVPSSALACQSCGTRVVVSTRQLALVVLFVAAIALVLVLVSRI